MDTKRDFAHGILEVKPYCTCKKALFKCIFIHKMWSKQTQDQGKEHQLSELKDALDRCNCAEAIRMLEKH